LKKIVISMRPKKGKTRRCRIKDDKEVL